MENIESLFLFNRKQQLFLNFINHTDQEKNAVQHMQGVVSDVLNNRQGAHSIRYLDVGCGYGYKTQAMIDFIKKSRSIHTTAVDPSSELLSIFKDRSKGKGKVSILLV